MAAKIKQMTDGTGGYVYPIAKASATYMKGGMYSVEEVLEDMQDDDTEIKFEEGKIIKEVASGNIVTTTFGDGRIIEVTSNSDGETLKTKTTVFNADGSISISTEGE